MVSLLQAIPIDVLEIVIISSRDYKLFEELQKVLIKLRQLNRVSRINDKLTIVIANIGEFLYKFRLNEKSHKEYDKPAEIFNNGSIYFYLNNIRNRKENYPIFINVNGGRSWRINGIGHRENDLPSIICADGYHEWRLDGKYFRKNEKTYIIHNFNGMRCYHNGTKCVFDYLDN